MHVGLDVKRAADREVLLGVAVIAVVGFGGEPAIKVIAIADEETASVGGMLGDSVSVGVFGEEAGALNAYLTAAPCRFFLRESG